MELVLKRIQLDGDCTIGALFVNGVQECFTCEDRERLTGPKVFGQTCIPRGKYDIAITYSPHFNRDLPELANVPNFEGVRIHPGNTPADTEGCLLPGLDRLPKGVGRSVAAFNPLFDAIKVALANGEKVSISIEGP